MSEISKITLPNGSEYDFKVYTNHIAPMMSRTFQNIIGTANNFANATFYYGSIRPNDWYQTWGLKYRIKTYIPEKNGYVQVADVQLYGDQGVLRAFSSFNSVGALCAYCHDLYRLKIAGYNNGYGHALGVSIRSSKSPIDTEYKRTFIIDILETSNCTFTFFNECLKYSDIPGTGSTNYDYYSEIDYRTLGLQETGDTDTNTNDPNYQNRIYYSNPGLKAYAAGGRYTLTFTKNDNYVLPITPTDNQYGGQEKDYTTESFNPFGQIYYRNSSATIAADAYIENGTLYRQILVDARYSFTGVLNGASSVMSAGQLVYLVCTPQEDGSAKLAENPLSFGLPNSEDGLYYILLGFSYNTYQFELLLNNPVYMFKNGRIREVSNYAHCAGDADTVTGYTVNSNVPANAKFTDTVTTATTTGSGNAVTAISASNGALTINKDIAFATKQESLNHVIASKTQPLNQQAGDIWIIIK